MNRGFGIKQFEHRVFDCCYLQQIRSFSLRVEFPTVARLGSFLETVSTAI